MINALFSEEKLEKLKIIHWTTFTSRKKFKFIKIENEKLDTEQNLPQGGGGGDTDFGLDSPTKAQTKGKIGSATNFICPKTNFHISFSTSQNLKWIILARSDSHFWWE